VRFEYQGIGEVLLRPGSCVHQPAGIQHREIEHSDDLEMLEIIRFPYRGFCLRNL
jgi:hypothetical protein